VSWAYLQRLREYRDQESGLEVKTAPVRVALCYPNVYSVAASSLGFQVVYRLINAAPEMSAARAMLPDEDLAEEVPPGGVLTLEEEKPLASYPVVAFSISYEMDLVGIIDLLRKAGIPHMGAERTEDDPFVLVGGPMTLSNVLPLHPFADAVVMGDAEAVLPTVLEILRSAESHPERRQRLAEVAGVYVPEHHGWDVPEPNVVGPEYLPAYGTFWTPRSELSNMFLVESSRGCPQYCKFCVVRAANTPMRYPDAHEIQRTIPAEAPRVGFVGAAVSEYPHIKELLASCIDRDQEIGLSSLRADVLDDEFVELLVRGGARTMTIASDAPSELQRSRLAKGLKERHLLHAAELARKHGLHRLKVYAIIGLPEETDADLDELARFALEMSRIHKVTLAVNPLIPKLRTPLAGAPFCSISELNRKIKLLRKRAGRRVDFRFLSPRWAWVESMLSLGGPETGMAAVAVSDAGGGYHAWKAALKRVDQPFAARDYAEETARSSWLPRR